MANDGEETPAFTEDADIVDLADDAGGEPESSWLIPPPPNGLQVNLRYVLGVEKLTPAIMESVAAALEASQEELAAGDAHPCPHFASCGTYNSGGLGCPSLASCKVYTDRPE